MRDIDKRDPGTLLYCTQFRSHPLAQLQIQCGQRFIKEQNLRLGTKRPGNGHPLLLATGKLIDHLFGLAR